MSWVDLVVAAMVALGAFRGRASGALRQIGNLIGLAAGFVLGTWIAPPLAHRVTSTLWRPFAAVALVVACAVGGAMVGRVLARQGNLSLRRMRLGSIDSTAGAIVGVVSALLTAWFFAGILSASTWAGVSTGISSSKILAVLDVVMPPVPTLEARVTALMRRADFPSVFANVVQPAVPTLAVPRADSNGIAALWRDVQRNGTVGSVLKIFALDRCGSTAEGTAFVVRPGYVMTNAHVVAGAQRFTVGDRPATLVLFDPRNDLAVLRTSTQHLPPLRVADGTAPATGTNALVIGFPLNGARTMAPAATSELLHASSRDIYAGPAFTRALLVVNTTVHPGNSGSPVLTAAGVVGVIFAGSTTSSVVAYAVPLEQVRADVTKSINASRVSSGACLAS